MFLLVPAYPGCPGSKAVKRSLLLLYLVSDHASVLLTFFLLELPYTHSWLELPMPTFCCFKPHFVMSNNEDLLTYLLRSRVTLGTSSYIVLLVYRPGSAAITASFFAELSDVLD